MLCETCCLIELEILDFEDDEITLDVDFEGEVINVGGGIARETDPTVPEWAKQPNPPTYTAKDVGALSKEDVDQTYNPESENAQSGKAVAEAINEINTQLGDIDTALDNIIAIQESYIGGETE